MASKDVALVLSSGGPRGFAYIGAIEELVSRGYQITSVAGTSMGALIGGMYAAGKLEEVRNWMYSLDNWKVIRLMDIAFSRNSLVKGDKVIEALKGIVPDVDIEELDLPYKAVATDLYTGEEVVFEKGSLFEAIRASMSIPSLFRPVKLGLRTLVDGGIVNPIPLNRVERNGHDILVGFDVNDVDVEEMRQIVAEDAFEENEKIKASNEIKAEGGVLWEKIVHDDTIKLVDKMKMAGKFGHRVLKKRIEESARDENDFDPDANYFSILGRSFSLMIHNNARLMKELYPCDVMVNMPFDAFGEISDYAKAEQISELGRNLMAEALNQYEQRLEKSEA